MDALLRRLQVYSESTGLDLYLDGYAALEVGY